jgi:hypothetical protein
MTLFWMWLFVGCGFCVIGDYLRFTREARAQDRRLEREWNWAYPPGNSVDRIDDRGAPPLWTRLTGLGRRNI